VDHLVALLVEFGDGKSRVIELIARVKAIGGRVGFAAVLQAHPSRRVAVEAQLDSLVVDDDLPRQIGAQAVCDAVVVRAEDDPQPVAQLDRELRLEWP
jgi:hypothetical protein